MLVFTQKPELTSFLSEQRNMGKTVGFVPTMGALHSGHVSLIERAMKENDTVVCSIFVNPTQFNESSDFDKYPRNIEKDKKTLEDIGCQVVFLPSVEDVYEDENKIELGANHITSIMEGVYRPGHFDGVVRVITQFFKIIKPSKSYFGLKDYQQYFLVDMLAKKMGNVGEVVGCDTVREASGLAKSSRNERLSGEELEKAGQIYQSFMAIKAADNLEKAVFNQKELLSKDFDVEYLEVRDGETLEKLQSLSTTSHARVFFAGKIGNVRLIDNLRIK